MKANLFFFQLFIHKLPCQVFRILDLVDCPPYNIVHDIVHNPIYYDPLYYPEIFPESFETPFSVKLWLETSLNSHQSVCSLCFSNYYLSRVRFNVQWRDPYYMICSYVNGKLKQWLLSLENLQSKQYSHCQIVSKLCSSSFLVPVSASDNGETSST